MKIFYSKRKTHNLGNYENVVIQISAEDEVDSIIESKEECFLRLKTFVDRNLEEQLAEISKLNKDGVITHEKVKNLVILITKRDKNKHDIIKQHMISRYNVSKIADLSADDLVEFNTYLKVM